MTDLITDYSGPFLRLLRELADEHYRFAAILLAQDPALAARYHENGLLLDLLAHASMRAGTMCVINVTTYPARDEQERITRLRIPATKTKNGVAIDVPLPSDLADHLTAHLTSYRPHLAGSDSCWLFPSEGGSRRTPQSITARIRLKLQERLRSLRDSHSHATV